MVTPTPIYIITGGVVGLRPSSVLAAYTDYSQALALFDTLYRTLPAKRWLAITKWVGDKQEEVTL